MKRIILWLLVISLLAALAAPGFAEAFPTDFVLGVDVSELIAQELSGVKYYDKDGEEADALAVLAGYGVDHIRVRVWNDPYDEEGHGYGGGNCDVANAAALSARAASLGMKTLVDFHYSDFWADPTRQLAPKAWAGMTGSEKEEALYDFTREALLTILEAGGDVDAAQVGNETNYGMAGESDTATVATLIAAGCRAVKDVASERDVRIMTCVHLTDILKPARVAEVLEALEAAGAECDGVGLSYYPYWHGGLDDFEKVVTDIRENWGKQVFVAETAWPFTLEDGDDWGNVIGEVSEPWPASPEGQTQALCNVCRAAQEAGATGVYYWGGIWTPVWDDAGKNWELWENFGSGWASSYAAGYDPDNVADSYGGCAWDNQALFDFGGHPLEVLDAVASMAEGVFPEGIEAPEAPEETSDAEGENLVLNPSFEEEDRSMWIATSETGDIPFDYQDYASDAHSGNLAFHYWSKQDMRFTVEQTLTGLADGSYEASAWSQGGDMKDAELVLYAIADGQRYEASFMNTSWANWQHPIISGIPVTGGELTIGISVKCAALGWGTLDDFCVKAE